MFNHRRELKRQQLQDRSRFKIGQILHVSPSPLCLPIIPDSPLHPVLFHASQEQYLLVCLLGKGGFSEVWKAFDLGPRLTHVVCGVISKFLRPPPVFTAVILLPGREDPPAE